MMETNFGGFSTATAEALTFVVLGVVLAVILALINVIVYRLWLRPNVGREWGVGKPRSKFLRRGNQGDSKRRAA